jgi:hypothetical protein
MLYVLVNAQEKMYAGIIICALKVYNRHMVNILVNMYICYIFL